MFRQYLQTPIGILCIVSDAGTVTEVSVCAEFGTDCPDALTEQACRELTEYFAGIRTEFTVSLAPQGTAFQQTVWRALRKIPFGQTVTYAQLAAMIGKASACRAVGSAVGKNPILILQPCHRVVASNGIGGFSAGTERKRFLLMQEGIF